MTVGKLSEFDVKTGQWSSYVDRLEMFILVDKVTEELKLPTLISTIGDEAYELLVNLSSPKKPSELSYDAAIGLMSQYLQPTPSSLAERYRFRQKRQGADENVATYVTELKRLARHCKFAGNLNENLRDQFICGLKSDVIRQRLFAEDDSITFLQAVKLANALEAAERDAAVVEETATSTSTAEAVHSITLSKRQTSGASYGRNGGSMRPRGSRGHGGPGGGSGGGERAANVRARQARLWHRDVAGNYCTACGATNHGVASCRYREFVCSKCQRAGHLRRVCPENVEQPSASRDNITSYRRGRRNGKLYSAEAVSESDVEDIEESLNLIGLNNY